MLKATLELSILAKELPVGTCIMQSSSIKLSTRLPFSVLINKRKVI